MTYRISIISIVHFTGVVGIIVVPGLSGNQFFNPQFIPLYQMGIKTDSNLLRFQNHPFSGFCRTLKPDLTIGL